MVKVVLNLDKIINAHTMPKWRRISNILISFIILFILWSSFAQLDEVAIARGEVTPQGKVKTIQHLEGGIIDTLLVADGDVVRKGTPLAQLDLAGTTTNLAELKVRQGGLVLKRIRLQAEASGDPLDFPTDLTISLPELQSAEQASYTARINEFQSTRAVLVGQAFQKNQDLRELEEQLKATKIGLTLARQRLAISEDLIKDQLTSPMDHLQIKRDVGKLEGDFLVFTESLLRLESALTEAKERVKEWNLKFAREASEQIRTTELELAQLKEILATAADRETRTTIRSPITGVVKNLRYTTIGGVVKSGDPIMDIVPSEDTLVISARLNPMDRGFVHAGQKAVVKIDTYDYSRYGGIEGLVISVAPDSTISSTGQSYFKVMISTKEPWLGEEFEGLLISPGMGATIDIHTGTKSVLSYLIKPIIKLRTEAFRER